MADEIVNIGINHPAYKVSKRELLEWMNSTLNTNISNVDKDVGDGAAYAQLFHSINKKCVSLKQVKFQGKSEYEYTINYGIVHKAMKTLNIEKVIPSEALMKGKPLDNIEFVQWLKHYHSHVASEEDYDGFAEREAKFPGLGKKDKRWNSYGGAAAAPAKKAAPAAKKPMASNQARPASRAAPAKAAGGGDGGAALKAAQEELAAQKEEISELNLNVDALTKERDFYFGKLRDVEILIQEKEGTVEANVQEAFEQIKAILYATDEAAEEDF
jgi:RP/EB family microtubule-associated protein